MPIIIALRFWRRIIIWTSHLRPTHDHLACIPIRIVTGSPARYSYTGKTSCHNPPNSSRVGTNTTLAQTKSPLMRNVALKSYWWHDYDNTNQFRTFSQYKTTISIRAYIRASSQALLTVCYRQCSCLSQSKTYANLESFPVLTCSLVHTLLVDSIGKMT